MKTGVYKTVFADLWEQEWFLDLTDEEKIVFLNVMTARYNRQIGVYLPVARFQAMQCGITVNEFTSILDGFVRRGILLRSPTTGEIAIPSYLVEHFGKGGEPAIHILNNEAGSVKDQAFLQSILQKSLDEAKTRKDLSVNNTLLDFLKRYLATSDVPSSAENDSSSNAPPDQPSAITVHESETPLSPSVNWDEPEEPLSAVKNLDEQQNEAEPSRSASCISSSRASPSPSRPKDESVASKAELTIDSIFNAGKYAGKDKSYLEIANEDPGYAQWWVENEDVRNPQIHLLFKLALAKARGELPILDCQIKKFQETYPPKYQNDSAMRILSGFTYEEAESMLTFLYGCVDMNWAFVDEIPKADYFLIHWEELRKEWIHKGYLNCQVKCNGIWKRTSKGER